MTLSRRSADGQHVIGADFTLSNLSNQMEALAFAPRTKLALLDAEGRLLAQHQLETEDKTGQDLQQSKTFSPYLRLCLTILVREIRASKLSNIRAMSGHSP